MSPRGPEAKMKWVKSTTDVSLLESTLRFFPFKKKLF